MSGDSEDQWVKVEAVSEMRKKSNSEMRYGGVKATKEVT